jgi:hypothetical protein
MPTPMPRNNESHQPKSPHKLKVPHGPMPNICASPMYHKPFFDAYTLDDKWMRVVTARSAQ